MCLYLSRTVVIYKGSKFPRNLVQLRQYIMMQWCRMWNKPDTMGFCPLLCQLLQHTNQSVLLFLTHHHFHDPFFFSPLDAQHCVRAEGAEQWCQWPFHLWGSREGGVLKARRKSCDQQRRRQLEWKSSLLSTHVGLRAQVWSQLSMAFCAQCTIFWQKKKCTLY